MHLDLDRLLDNTKCEAPNHTVTFNSHYAAAIESEKDARFLLHGSRIGPVGNWPYWVHLGATDLSFTFPYRHDTTLGWTFRSAVTYDSSDKTVSIFARMEREPWTTSPRGLEPLDYPADSVLPGTRT